VVDGDAVLGMMALWLKPRAVVATSMSNFGLEQALQDQGIQLIRTDVGDRFVLEAMLEENLWLGGEQSGHIIFRDVLPAGDGLVTALKVLEIMEMSGKKLSELAAQIPRFPQILRSIPVRSKPPLESVPQIQQAALRVRKSLGTRGRLLLRYSGTEDLCRIMLEGEGEIDRFADDLEQAVLQTIGGA
jgi:phosphoglucosamine mutase